MRAWTTAILCASALVALAGVMAAQDQQGPLKTNGDTVAKKKPADSTAPADGDLPKIPSEYKKDKMDVGNLQTFKAESDQVTVDVSVLDKNGHFIPGIQKNFFRVLEDNVPQQVTSYNVGEAPMTIAMVIEFSNKFQQLYGYTWFQTSSRKFSRISPPTGCKPRRRCTA